MRLRIPAAVLACAALGALAPAAGADVGIGAATSFTARFDTARPGAAAGLSLRTTGSPPAEGTTEAPAVRQLVTLPAGTRLALEQLPQCTATDEQLAADGAEAACPAETHVGSGRAEGILRGQPVVFDLVAYGVRGALFFAAEQNGMPLEQGFYGRASGRRLALVVPTLDGAIAPTLFRASIPRGDGRWLRTPARCPRAHKWSFGAAFQGLTAASGGSPVGAVQLRRATSRCRR